MQEIKKIVRDVGPENVVQIVTDNGSNFKKACALLHEEYNHIVWQPCLAHTINLMLKDIGKWPEHDAMIKSAQRICSWMYNSNSLHAMMSKAIGGELVKWNATRFGTNYMFLETFLRKKDQFMAWMVSPEFRNSRHFKSPEGQYAFRSLTALDWWNAMQSVIDDVEPLYIFLRFADHDKTPTLGEVLMEYQNTRQTYASKFAHDEARFRKITNDIIARRLVTVMMGTYVQAACTLHPYVNYVSGVTDGVLGDMKRGMEMMFDTTRATKALQEYEYFRRKYGEFGSDLAIRMARDRSTSPASWWSMFGSDTPTLQRAAMRLLSQCVSSSGCERNWSTFAFIHTKLRNRMGHKKLHKLVFVNYNLRLRIQRAKATPEPSDFDPIAGMMDLSLYRQQSAIRKWMELGRSNAAPALDEDSDLSDTPVPSTIVTDIARDIPELRNLDVREWAEETVGDTHVGKRKTRVGPSDRQRKKGKRQDDIEEEEFRTDDSTPDPSVGDDDDHDDGGDDSSTDASDDGIGSGGYVGGGGGGDDVVGGGEGMRFTGESQFTHATQDTDHGAPSSQRQTRSSARHSIPHDDDSSSSVNTDYTYPHYPYDQPYAYPSSHRVPYLPPPYVGYTSTNMQDAYNVQVNGGLATSLYYFYCFIKLSSRSIRRLKDMRHMVPMAHMGPMEPMAIAHINRMRLKNKLHVVCIV